MSETRTVVCDQCRADLTSTGAMPAYRIALLSQSLGSTSSIVYDVMVHDPLEKTKHFCNLKCLKEWLA